MSSRLPTRRFRRSASSRAVVDQAAPGRLVQPRAVFLQAGQRAGDGDQRRAQVVGDRVEQRALQLLGGLRELRLARLLGQLGALDGQGGLAGKGFEQPALVGRQV